jgi:hypothetical protein
MELQMATDAEICDNHFRFEGIAYFRGHADAVQLGDAGEKRQPASQPSHLAVQACVARDTLPMGRASLIDVHAIAFSGSDIGTSVVVPGVGTLGASTLARQLADQTLALVKLETAAEDIVAAADESPAVIAALVRAGSKGRLVHQVFVILEMKTALHFTCASSFEANGAGTAWSITGTRADGSRTVLTIVPGTTFAYLLLKPKRAANQQRHETRIEAWEEESWSLQ